LEQLYPLAPSEIEAAGYQVLGNDVIQGGTNIPFPIYQYSTEYRVKGFNGVTLHGI
jgi:hypothetical protein